MKRTGILVVLMLACSVALAQLPTEKIISAGSYAATYTGTWLRCSPTADLVLGLYFRDSVNVTIQVDYRMADVPDTIYSTYAVLAGDSTKSTYAAGIFRSYVLRDGNTDNIPGATEYRIRLPKLTTLNGVTTPTFDAWMVKWERPKGQ